MVMESCIIIIEPEVTCEQGIKEGKIKRLKSLDLKAAWFFCLIVFSFFSFQSQSSDKLKFTHLGKKIGLPQASIICIYKASDGRLWVGTQNGLSWFDGYRFHSFHTDANNPNAISNDYIKVITEDSEGYLWIGTRSGGLNRYDPETNHFRSYKHDPNVPTSIGSNDVLSLLFDKKGRFWVGTSGGGLNLFNLETTSFTRFKHDPENINSIAGNDVKAILEDKAGHLWLGLSTAPYLNNKGNGLDYFNPEDNSFTHFKYDPENENSLLSNEVSTLYLDEDDTLWIGTYLGGLNHLNPTTNQITRYRVDISDPTKSPAARMMAISKADGNGLWIATIHGGLSYFNKKTQVFTRHNHEAFRPTSLSHQNASSLLQDENNLWVGTWWNGLNKLNLSSQNFGWSHYDPNVKSGLPLKSFRSFAEDRDGNIWIAAHESGLVKWDRKENTYDIITHFPGSNKDWRASKITSVFIDSADRLWVGTIRKGLYKFDWNNQIFTHYKPGNNRQKHLHHVTVNSIIEYPKGILWLGSRGGGISRFDTEQESFIHFRHDPDDPESINSNMFSNNSVFLDSRNYIWFGSEDAGAVRIDPHDHSILKFSNHGNGIQISHNLVTAITEDSRGHIWLATFGGGLDKLYHHQGRWRVENYSTKNTHMPHNTIDTLAIDQQDNLWFTTSSNILRFNIQTESLNSFNTFDGSLPGAYNDGAQFIGKDGTIYFGGIDGFSHFSPNKILINVTPPKIYLTDFSLFNQPVRISNNTNAPLKKVLAYTDRITLDHTQNVFSFSFTSLDYLDSEQNKYAYKMEGFNEDWIFTDANNRQAAYTNLDSGNYTFKVIASNKDGLWSEQGKSVNLTILAAPWRTPWAYGAYFLTSILLLYAFLHLATKRRMAEAANEAKSNFLATMSHEIRTPINGVIGAVSLLNECHLNEEQNNYARTIKVSGENLLYIVNEILDLSKIEAGKLELEKHDFNLRDCVEDALDLFTNEVAQKNNELIFIADDKVPLQVYSDSTRIRQIIVNLVGNAIKFCDNGNINCIIEHLSKEESYHHLKFRIIDTGLGIPIDKQQHIFDAFKQADDSTTRHHGGTGLGLTICQRLVTIFGGEIAIESEEGKGTEFYFDLKLETRHSFTSINQPFDEIRLNNKIINLIGCDKYQQQFFKSLAKNARFQINFLLSNLDAIKQIQQGPKPDIILVNLNPVDSAPLFVAEQIKQQKDVCDIPLVILTNPHDAHHNADQFHTLFNAHIFKPFRMTAIIERFSNLLNETSKQRDKKSPLLSETFSHQHPLSILLAEDNAVNQKILLYTFRKLGYNPDIVSNGFEVLHAVIQKNYDLLITDIQMPGMSGLEAIEIILKNKNCEELIIAIFSADVTINLESLLEQDVIQNVLSKPLSLKKLKEFLRESSLRIAGK